LEARRESSEINARWKEGILVVNVFRKRRHEPNGKKEEDERKLTGALGESPVPMRPGIEYPNAMEEEEEQESTSHS
jgi:hypothetical protein